MPLVRNGATLRRQLPGRLDAGGTLRQRLHRHLGISGTKAYCCKVEAPCKYGTPGCPYPPFGSSGNEATPPSSGPQPPPDVIKGRQQESSGSGSDVLVPEPSTGPSPFGSSTKPPIDTGILKQRPDAYKVLPPAQAVNPCGKGMHKGGDGKCYPNLN
jgi:hypothetical protein